MNYAEPAYPREEVNKAGRRLCNLDGNDDELIDAIIVIDNWRASHAYPLQLFYMNLRRRAQCIHAAALVAQRTKRLVSIWHKLINESNMKLSQMQDIGGCRAVLPRLHHVHALEAVYKAERTTHEPLSSKDYIEFPKPNGYRSLHLKYRYCGIGKKAVFNGLKIEIQIRTKLQHQWATAVEAADIFTNQALKANKGREEWHRFFALMSSVFALRERSPLVPDTPRTLQELAKEINELNAKHHMLKTFMAYRGVIAHVEKRKDSSYYLVTLDPVAMTAQIRGFSKKESQLANKEYTKAEEAIGSESPTKVVLVSVSSIGALRKAYPNYFLETNDFLKEINAVLNRATK